MAPQRRNWFGFGRVQDYPLPCGSNAPQPQRLAVGITQQQNYAATKDIDSNEAVMRYGGILYTTTYPTKKKATNYHQYNDINVGRNNVYYNRSPVPAKNEYQYKYYKFTTTVKEENRLRMVYKAGEN